MGGVTGPYIAAPHLSKGTSRGGATQGDICAVSRPGGGVCVIRSRTVRTQTAINPGSNLSSRIVQG